MKVIENKDDLANFLQGAGVSEVIERIRRVYAYTRLYQANSKAFQRIEDLYKECARAKTLFCTLALDVALDVDEGGREVYDARLYISNLGQIARVDLNDDTVAALAGGVDTKESAPW